MAGPIEFGGVRYKNIGDRNPSQEYEVTMWAVRLDRKIQELEKKYPNYKIYTFGRAYAYRFFYSQLLYDVLWAGLSCTLVWIYITFHTKSIFIGSTAMAMILFSFPITLVIYKKIMMVSNLSSLHLMITFVVLGISADNIFVFWDAWR